MCIQFIGKTLISRNLFCEKFRNFHTVFDDPLTLFHREKKRLENGKYVSREHQIEFPIEKDSFENDFSCPQNLINLDCQ